MKLFNNTPNRGGRKKDDKTVTSYMIEEYLQNYVNELITAIRKGDNCLLSGPVGGGKTQVVDKFIKRLAELTPTIPNICHFDGEATSTLKSITFLKKTIEELQTNFTDISLINDEPALTHLLLQIVQASQKELVIIIDHIQMFNHAPDILRALRQLLQASDSLENIQERHCRILCIIISSGALNDQLVTSPIGPYLHEPIQMKECPIEQRLAHWQRLLEVWNFKGVPNKKIILDGLCGGDQYHIDWVANLIAQKPEEWRQKTDAGLRHAILKRLDLERKQPQMVRLHAKFVEEVPKALDLTLRLLKGENPSALEFSFRYSPLNNVNSDDIFKTTNGIWAFRNEIIREYLKKHFIDIPENTADALCEQDRYEDAAEFLISHTTKDLDNVTELREVILEWINSLSTPIESWRALARFTQLLFGDTALILRFLPERQSTDNPYPYRIIKPHTGEQIAAENELAKSVHDYFEKVKADPLALSQSLRHIINENDEQLILVSMSNKHEYGCVIIPSKQLDPQHTGWKRLSDKAAHYKHLYDMAFARLRQKEERERASALNQLLLAAQKTLHDYRETVSTHKLIYTLLTAMTANFGTRFNRCVFFQALGGGRLQARAGIGAMSQLEADQEWDELDFDNDSFDKVVQRMLHPNAIGLGLPSPLQAYIENNNLTFFAKDDPLFRDIYKQDAAIKTTYEHIQQSAISTWFGVTSDFKGRRNSTFIIPMWQGDYTQGGDLLGVLVADKLFTDSPIHPDEESALLNLAEHLESVLLFEQENFWRTLLQEINDLVLQRLSLNEAITSLCDLLKKARKPNELQMSWLVPWLSIALWDKDRKQATKRCRIALDPTEPDSNAAWNWNEYIYYVDNPTRQHEWGALVGILANPRDFIQSNESFAYFPSRQAIPEYYINTPGKRGIESFFVAYLHSEDRKRTIGSIEFKSRMKDAFSPKLRTYLLRLTIRIAMLLDKARVQEGSDHSKYHNKRLTEAMQTMVMVNSTDQLHNAIIEQMRLLFSHNGDETPSEQMKAINGAPAVVALYKFQKNTINQINEIAWIKGDDTADLFIHQCLELYTLMLKHGQVCVEYASYDPKLYLKKWGETQLLNDKIRTQMTQSKPNAYEACLWIKLNEELFAVLTWQHPRRISGSEQTSLPLLAEIILRANNVVKTKLAADLNKVLQEVVKFDDLGQILEIIKTACEEHIAPIPVTVTYREYDAIKGQLRIHPNFAHLVLPQYRILSDQQGIVGHVARSKQIGKFSDVEKCDFYVKSIEATQSEVAVPVLLDDKVVGVLDIQARIKDAFDKTYEEFLRALASQIAIVIVRARELDEKKIIREELYRSLTLDAYETIEDEYSHQYSRIMREIGNNIYLTKKEINLLENSYKLTNIMKHLNEAARWSTSGLKIINENREVKYIGHIHLESWLISFVDKWNKLNYYGYDLHCEIDMSLSPNRLLETREVILRWLLQELLRNANKAEEKLPKHSRKCILRAKDIPGGVEIGIVNNAKFDKQDLQLLKSGMAIKRDDGTGRGLWIALGQVKSILGGKLILPAITDNETYIALHLPFELSKQTLDFQ